jgi:eukaryotic-like serine/threonine-protein kinase
VSVLDPGAIFGRDFRIVKALRAGGMGAVYIADQLSTGKQRALKVMAPELATDPSIRERFVLEARAAANIESDHVVEIVTAGVDDESGAPFLVMELLKGEELADAATRLGPLPLGDVAEVLSQIGHALEQAHAQGIVHRDLKPENIFLASSRRRDGSFTAKVLDFGIAKLVEDSRQKTGTQPLGSPLFMSPEQTDRKGRIVPATDVWALGLIAFRLLTGRDFWLETDSLPMLLREICVDPIPFASARVAELSAQPIPEGLHPVPPVPAGFDAWFARCVNRDVDARFPDAGAAVRAFLELVTTDAPRGALHVTFGEGLGASGALPSSQITAPAPSVQIRPVGDTGASTTAALARTGLATGPAAAPPASSSKLWIGVAAAVAVAAVIGWRVTSGGGAPAQGSATATPTAPPARTTPATAASASATAAAAPSACPEGMLSIPAGKMFMGARDLSPDTKPPHQVSLSAFCIDRTEVTVKAYLACVEKGNCERPPDKVSWPKITDAQVKRYSPLCNASQKGREDHPVNCVAWSMAQNFCKKRGARLPTEAEWELAARGSVQHKYPWGDDAPSKKHLNACGTECAKWAESHGDKLPRTMYDDDDGFVGTAPVGSFPAGAAPSGAVDLAGNVWEWTADWYGPYTDAPQKDPKGPDTGTQRVARGGDFAGYQPDWARPAFRWKTDPETFNHAIGFRCAADAK